MHAGRIPWAWPYLACAAAAVGAAGLVSATRPDLFSRYLDGANPVVALIVVAIAGLVGLAALRVSGPFFISAPKLERDGPIAAAIVGAFAITAIAADLVFRFPADMNAPLPWSVLFYPAMGFFAEVCFHVLPLALLLTWAPQRRAALTLCVIATAAIEPLFQVRAAVTHPQFTPLDVFVFAQVLAFNLFELYVFRRHGFVSMFAVRLGYYLCWHVLWGALRLPLLFN